MAKMFQVFNPAEVDPTQSKYALVPGGKYKVVIPESEVKPNSAKTGGMLVLDVRVIEGEYTGYTVPDRLNLWNESAQAVDIAQRRLSAICYAVGRANDIIEDSAVLHNIPFMVEIVEEEGKPYLDRTSGEQKAGAKQSKIVRIYDVNGNLPTAGAASNRPQTAPAQQPPQPPQPQQQAPQAQPQPQPQFQQPQQQPAAQPQGAPAWSQGQGMPPGVAQPQQPPQAAPAWGGQPAAQAQQPQAAPAWGGPPAGGTWGGPAA